MTPPTIVGVDPGGRHVGIVVRRGDQLLEHRALERVVGRCRTGSPAEPLDEWALRVARTVETVWWSTAPDRIEDLGDPPAAVAVEGVNEPIPQMGLTNLRGLIDTAVVLGAVLGRVDGLARTLLVPPGRHGRAAEGLGRPGLLAAYPDALVGDQERGGRGGRPWRDLRAAWDIAGAAARQMRQRTAT